MNHHEGMNHDDMGHGGMDHGGMDMGGCSPQMLWNGQYEHDMQIVGSQLIEHTSRLLTFSRLQSHMHHPSRSVAHSVTCFVDDHITRLDLQAAKDYRSDNASIPVGILQLFGYTMSPL